MARKQVPPDGYVFLLAAGEIDFLESSGSRPNSHRCAAELERLAAMNGSYEKLPSEFRANMREEVGGSCDNETAEKLAELARSLRRLDELDDDARRKLRAHCSSISRHWPMRPTTLVV